MINFASNLNKMIDAGLGGPLDPPRTEVAVGHRVVYTEASGAVVNFETNVIAPIKKLRVTMAPIQDLHGYDKPWPVGSGKNMISFPYSTADGTYVGVTFATDSVGKITASGTTTSGMNFVLVRNGELPAGTYTLSIKGAHMGSSLLLRDLDASVMVAQIVPASTDASITFTVSEDISQYNLYFNTSSIGTEVNISAYVQLEPGSVATDYAPYSNICPITGREAVRVYRSGSDMSDPQIVTVQLGQTVYGGTLDVSVGKLAITNAMVDLGMLNWNNSGGNKLFYTSGVASEIRIPTSNTEVFSWGITSIGLDGKSYNSITQSTPYSICVSMSGSILATLETSQAYPDGSAFKAAMSGVQLCYELATPVELTLAPAQLTTLLGQNNVWSDAGNISLEYPYYEETEGY